MQQTMPQTPPHNSLPQTSASLPFVHASSIASAHRTDALMPICARPAPVMVRGAGSYLWDNQSKRYLDFLQGWAVNCLGHCPPELVDALTIQSQQLITPSPALHNAPQLALADALTHNSPFAQVHFANSGAEANEAAIKLARKWGQQERNGAATIITTTNAFHGRTLATMAASGKPGWSTMYPPMPQGFGKVAFGDIDALAAQITDDTVAVMLEPIQGEAGVVIPPQGYLRAVRALTRAKGVLLILDEVQTGMGRTGTLHAHQHEGIEPDIMTLGKGIGAGVPLSAVLATAAVSRFEYGDQGGTYNGNPLMCAVGLRVLQTINTPEFLANVREKAQLLRAGLEQLQARHDLVSVRGQGLLYALQLPWPHATNICDRAFEQGLLINPAQPDVLRFMPSLRVTGEEIAAMLELLDEILATQPI